MKIEIQSPWAIIAIVVLVFLLFIVGGYTLGNIKLPGGVEVGVTPPPKPTSDIIVNTTSTPKPSSTILPPATNDASVATSTQKATIQPTQATATSSEIRTTCVESPYTHLNDGISDKLFEPTTEKAVKIYSHCPPFSPIQYVDIAVDDMLKDVRLVCRESDSGTKIKDEYFTRVPKTEQLEHWTSKPITIPPGCRIDFEIADTLGVNIGIMFVASGVQ